MINRAFVNRIDQNKWTLRGGFLGIILICIGFALSESIIPEPFIFVLIAFGMIFTSPLIFVYMWKSQHIEDLIPQGNPKLGKVLVINKFDSASALNILSDRDKSRFLRQPGIIDKIDKWSKWYEVSFDDNGFVGQGMLKTPIRIDESLSALQVKYQEAKNGRGKNETIILEVAGPIILLSEILNNKNIKDNQ